MTDASTVRAANFRMVSFRIDLPVSGKGAENVTTGFVGERFVYGAATA